MHERMSAVIGKLLDEMEPLERRGRALTATNWRDQAGPPSSSGCLDMPICKAI